MPNTVRWLVVLPGAILCALFSSFPVHFVLYQSLTGSGIVEPYPQAPERLLSPLVAAIAFVWAGARIAPYRKFEAAVALFGGWLLLCGVVVTLGLTGARLGAVQMSVQMSGFPFAGAIFGAFIGLYLTHCESISHNAKLGRSGDA